MSYRTFSKCPARWSSLHLQKSLYFNVWLYPVWWISASFFLNLKFYNLAELTRYFSTSALAASICIELVRVYLGYSGNLYNNVDELAGFWMLTVLMQIPLISFFTFNPYLHNNPTEITLNCFMFAVLTIELLFGYLALKNASALAKNIYLSTSKLTKHAID